MPRTSKEKAAGTAVGSVVLLKQFLRGTIALDRYFFLSGAVMRIGGALNSVFGILGKMQEPALFVRNYFEVIDRRPRAIDRAGALVLPAAGPPEITFDNVCFGYPGHARHVFTDLSFTIRTSRSVSHRFSTVRRAHRIIVLEHGGIAEQGTHAELPA